MYTAYLFGALIIVMGEGALRRPDARGDKSEQRILLRKLQSFQRTEVNNETVTWNEILADVLVRKLNVFSGEDDREVKKPGLATRFFSRFLYLYKSIYDQYKSDTDDESTKTAANPKDEVETIDAAIKNEGCEECHEAKPEKSVEQDGNTCPDGYKKNKDGNCEDPVSQRIIIAVPNVCPLGYRHDRLGFCRLIFHF